MRNEAIKRRKVWKLKEDDTRARFYERVGELVSANAPDLWKCFREGMLKAYDEVCGKTKGRKDQEYVVVEQGCEGSDREKEGYTQGDV